MGEKPFQLHIHKHLEVESHIVLQKNRLATSGILKRFSTDCYGKQVSWEDAKSEKSRKFMTFIKQNQHKKNYKKDPVYESNFLNYKPYLIGERNENRDHDKRRSRRSQRSRRSRHHSHKRRSRRSRRGRHYSLK